MATAAPPEPTDQETVTAAERAHLEWERVEAQKGWDDYAAGRYVVIRNDADLKAVMAGCRERAMELVRTGKVKPSVR